MLVVQLAACSGIRDGCTMHLSSAYRYPIHPSSLDTERERWSFLFGRAEPYAHSETPALSLVSNRIVSNPFLCRAPAPNQHAPRL